MSASPVPNENQAASAGPFPPADEAAAAAAELAALRSQIEQARAVLAGLQRDVAEAENRLGSSEAAQLLEANEQLVFATLRAQTEAESAAAALTEAAKTAELDALTGLPNRVLMLDRFANAIASARRRGARLALLFLDLDNFKQINDTLGHATGDEVLRRVAHSLGSAVRDSDTVSRHGGDEFLILLSEVSQRSDAALVAEKVDAALRKLGPLVAGVPQVTASIGISLYPDDGQDADVLIDRADAAMYRVKRQAPGGIAFHGAGTA